DRVLVIASQRRHLVGLQIADRRLSVARFDYQPRSHRLKLPENHLGVSKVTDEPAQRPAPSLPIQMLTFRWTDREIAFPFPLYTVTGIKTTVPAPVIEPPKRHAGGWFFPGECTKVRK